MGEHLLFKETDLNSPKERLLDYLLRWTETVLVTLTCWWLCDDDSLDMGDRIIMSPTTKINQQYLKLVTNVCHQYRCNHINKPESLFEWNFGGMIVEFSNETFNALPIWSVPIICNQQKCNWHNSSRLNSFASQVRTQISLTIKVIKSSGIIFFVISVILFILQDIKSELNQ